MTDLLTATLKDGFAINSNSIYVGLAYVLTLILDSKQFDRNIYFAMRPIPKLHWAIWLYSEQ